MCYSTNTSLEKAMKLLFIDELSVQIVADRFGVSRTTIWRWKRKWLALNSHIALENQVRQKDNPISSFRLSACSWRISSLKPFKQTTDRSLANTSLRSYRLKA